MQMRHNLALHLLVAASLQIVPAAASSSNLQFTGVVARTCAITIGTPGVLDVGTSGTVLSSKNGIGTSATATIVSTGTDYQLDVTNPTSFLIAPTGVNGSVTFDTQYKLSGVTSALGVVGGVKTPLNVGSSLLTVDLTATRSSMFPAGAYSAQTTVTCE